MTDDELSELAECIADACAGVYLAPFYARSANPYGSRCSCCPLGALVGERYPNPGMVADWLGIPSEIAYGIARGFDGDGPIEMGPFTDREAFARAYALGQLFRAELVP